VTLQTKTLKINLADALTAVGGGENLKDTLNSLLEQKLIVGFFIELNVLVDRERAMGIEQYFLLNDQTVPRTKKKPKAGD